VSEQHPGDVGGPLAEFASGSMVAGYLLEERIGAGGMAVVFRARDQRLGRLVALKIMAPALAADEAFRQRFIRESRMAAAVDDPHIIPVYEAGEAGGVLFIAMRFVRGGDVRSLLHREGPLPAARVAAIVSPVASALDAAHAAGLVHRDVKPANMLVDARPDRPDHVYLSDFGLSKGALSSAELTRSGQFLGTAAYSAPEQIEGRPVDGRTDQYALACAAYEMLAGEAPFQRDQELAVIWAHLSQPPPSLTGRRADLPSAVDPVFARALAKTPGDRYPSCGEFADAVREALGLDPYVAGRAAAAPADDPGPAARQQGAAAWLPDTGPAARQQGAAAWLPDTAAWQPGAPAPQQGMQAWQQSPPGWQPEAPAQQPATPAWQQGGPGWPQQATPAWQQPQDTPAWQQPQDTPGWQPQDASNWQQPPAANWQQQQGAAAWQQAAAPNWQQPAAPNWQQGPAGWQPGPQAWGTALPAEAVTMTGRRAGARRPILIAGGAVVVVVAVVVTLVVVNLRPHPASNYPKGALPQNEMAELTGVPVTTLDAVGAGPVFSYNPSALKTVSGSPLTSGSKPEMLYIGAEYCSYCGTMRWAVAVALSRFGTLSPVKGIFSASSGDAYPHTPSITFYRSTYSSQYVAFAPVENETDTKALLQQPTPAEQALWDRYDPDNNYPFIDIGNKYVITDALYSPAVLAGMTWAEVTGALHDPSSSVAQGVDGAANVITAAICTLTHNQPSSVCGSSVISGLESRL
jgi:hypothetical protein